MSATHHRLNVFAEDAHGSPSHEVWLDTEVADFDGICLGCGTTREEALLDAKEELEAALDAVNRELQHTHPSGEPRRVWEGAEP